jgi:hypothetical protein
MADAASLKYSRQQAAAARSRSRTSQCTPLPATPLCNPGPAALTAAFVEGPPEKASAGCHSWPHGPSALVASGRLPLSPGTALAGTARMRTACAPGVNNGEGWSEVSEAMDIKHSSAAGICLTAAHSEEGRRAGCGVRLPGWHPPTRWLSGSTSGREVMSSSTPRLLQKEAGRQRGQEAGKASW